MASASSSKPPSSAWKGKAKATTDSHFNDLNPAITYRHLYSQNLGVKDPLRVIALCDSDAFYAACEQVRLGLDPAKPLVVQQWDSLIAVNYPARKFGISRMDKIKDAKKRCPHLEVVHVATYKEGEAEPGYWENPDTNTHKVSLDHYRRESWKIYHMFKEGLPTGEVEKASIDEAFLDLTRPVREEILRRHPYLAEIPPDAPQGKDTPLPPPPPIIWDELGTLIPIQPDDSEDNEDLHTENSDVPPTWHDVALSIAAELMGKIRSDIYTKLGYSTSAGIARNKFLAKLTASYRKPNSQSILRNAAIPNYLIPLPFQKIRFLGGKLGEALAQEYDVSTVGDLLSVTLDELQRKFGEESIWVWEIFRGIDRSEVKEKPPVTKSMLAAKNLPHPIVKASEGYPRIRVLAAELALRLREARESIPALWPKSIVLHIQQNYNISRSKQAPFPFVRDVTVDTIAAAGDKLWKELVGTDSSRNTPLKVNHVSLAFSGIASMESGQRRIEGFFQKPQSSDAKGTTAPLKPPSPSTDDVLAPSLHEPVTKTSPQTAATALITDQHALSFVCERCGKRLSLPNDIPGRSGGDHSNVDEALHNEMQDALHKLRLEHDDFHFAQDLANQSEGGDRGMKRPAIRPSESQPSGKKRKKDQTKRKPTEGIARFFAPK